MGRPKNGTICSKHEKIYGLANQIQDLVNMCLEDGQNMERGLEEKRDRISELEAEIADLRKELWQAEKRIEILEDEVSDLSTKVVNVA